LVLALYLSTHISFAGNLGLGRASPVNFNRVCFFIRLACDEKRKRPVTPPELPAFLRDVGFNLKYKGCQKNEILKPPFMGVQNL